jgi:charged multivesicular body protein 5
MGTQFNVDNVQFTTEQIQTAIDTAETMKEAVGVQKQLMQKVNIDQMQDLADDMADMQEDTAEIQEILSENYSLDAFNEEEIMGELNDLDEDVLNSQLNESPSVPITAGPKVEPIKENPGVDLDKEIAKI